MKISIYSNPSYCLVFGVDTVFLDIKVEITQVSVVDGTFRCKILQAQLDPTQESFPISLFKLLSTEQLEKVCNDLQESLLAELQPSLFSLFYAGEIQTDATNTTA